MYYEEMIDILISYYFSCLRDLIRCLLIKDNNVIKIIRIYIFASTYFASIFAKKKVNVGKHNHLRYDNK